MKKLFLTLAFSFICLFAYAASPVTYYFNAYDSGGEEWESNPSYMVDGFDDRYAVASGIGDVQLLTGNTCAGTNLGTITKVELRAFAASGTDYDDVYLRPVFPLTGDGDNHDIGSLGGEWSAYIDITSDTNAPETWSWTNVQNLDCDVEDYGENLVRPRVSKVEIRVTYTGGAARRRIIMVE